MLNTDSLKIRDRLISFTVQIITLMNGITNSSAKFVLEKQILRSASSVGANYVEGNGGVSRKDWLNYMHIARKSILETEYWLLVLEKSSLKFDGNVYNQIYNECVELIKLFTSITKTGSLRYSNKK